MPKLYIASAPQDQALLQQFLQHLTPLQRAQAISIFSDADIQAGEDWDQAKTDALQKAELILLLVSPSFLANAFVYQHELPLAMQQQKIGKAKVIPIILRQCFWQEEAFAKRSILPSNQQPVTSGAWKNTDAAFAQIVEAIAQLVNQEIKDKPKTSLIVDGQYTDPRDGQSYPVCEFAGQTWFAQNLNFAIPEGGYWTYKEEAERLAQHGGLYTWPAAQVACPPGWRVASDADWQSLIDFFGNDYLAYKHLLRGGDSPLAMSLSGKWSATTQQLVLLDECGFYWSRESLNYEQGVYYMFDNGMASLRRISVDKKTGASVRCVLAD